jgi:hypothetical protein
MAMSNMLLIRLFQHMYQLLLVEMVSSTLLSSSPSRLHTTSNQYHTCHAIFKLSYSNITG